MALPWILVSFSFKLLISSFFFCFLFCLFSYFFYLFTFLFDYNQVIPFLSGNGLNNILNWGTLLFASVANFIIPFAVYIQACRFKQAPHSKSFLFYTSIIFYLHFNFNFNLFIFFTDLNENQKKILHELKLVPVHFGAVNEVDDDTQYKVFNPTPIIHVIITSSLSITTITSLSSRS